MYEYQYVTIKAKGAVVSEFQEHRDAFNRYAADGWRYVGWIPTRVGAHGGMDQLDLIFEREV